MERHAHHRRQPSHTRDAVRAPIRSDPNPIRSDPIPAQRSSGTVERMIEQTLCTTESINTIKLKDRGERAQGRERKKGQAQKEEVRHDGVNGGLGHGRVLLVRVAGEGARAPSTSECSSRIGEGQ